MEAAGQLVPDRQTEAFLHGHIPLIRREVRGGALGRGGQGCDAAAVRPGSAVRQGPALPELPEKFRILPARPGLGFDLFELELVAEVGAAVVDRLLPRKNLGGVLFRREQAGQHEVGEGKQSPGFGIHYQQFFLHAEGAHESIVRQDPPKRPHQRFGHSAPIPRSRTGAE